MFDHHCESLCLVVFLSALAQLLSRNCWMSSLASLWNGSLPSWCYPLSDLESILDKDKKIDFFLWVYGLWIWEHHAHMHQHTNLHMDLSFLCQLQGGLIPPYIWYVFVMGNFACQDLTNAGNTISPYADSHILNRHCTSSHKHKTSEWLNV